MTVANLFTSPHMTGAVVDSGGFTVSVGTTAVQALTATTGAFTSNIDQTSNGAFLIGRTTGAGAVLVIGVDGTNHVLIDNSALGVVMNGSANVIGNLSINTNKFTVAASTGNTVVAGTLVVSGATATMPLLVGIGGLTSAFPALKRSAGTLEVRAADDSGYTNLVASAISTATGDVFSLTNVTASTGVFKVGANQVVGARSTGWATQTVTTGAKTDIGASGTWTTTSVGNLLMAHHAALLAHGLIGA